MASLSALGMQGSPG